MSSEKISDEHLEAMTQFISEDIRSVALELQSSRRKLKQCEEALKPLNCLDQFNGYDHDVIIRIECSIAELMMISEALAALREGDK